MAREATIAASYGGQALIEGVMIRGPRATSMAVRRPDGSIITRSDTAEPGSQLPYRRVPFLRGVFLLCDTMRAGIRALYWSARISAGRDDEPLRTAEKITAAGTLVVAAAIFIAGPLLLTGWVERVSGSTLAGTVAEGVLRLSMLVGYVWFIGRLPEVQRVFQYHGAEHRAVHAYEHGRALTVKNLRAFPDAHPRCGTAFLLTVGVVSMVLFVALGSPPFWIRLVERITLAPVVAAAAYEFLRANQAHEDSAVMRVIAAPNLWLQRLTTREPDDTQIEVAIAAMREAISFGELLETPVSAAVVLATVEVESNDAE